MGKEQVYIARGAGRSSDGGMERIPKRKLAKNVRDGDGGDSRFNKTVCDTNGQKNGEGNERGEKVKVV